MRSISEGKIEEKMKPRAGHYRVSDVAKRIDRATTTVFRWEKDGLIPKARRDSRGWRIYTELDVETIIKLVRNTNYFVKKNYRSSKLKGRYKLS